MPVVFLGAGGIVRAAHLPAYAKAGIPVAGFCDASLAAARASARQRGGGRVFRSLEEAARQRECVFDVAVPAPAIAGILRALPDGAAVLIQKPLGRDFAEARRLVALCRRKRLVAAVNFQLRFAPSMLALRALLERGALGDPTDFEVRTNTHTPWSLWKFMAGIPRLELLYHSIHSLDLARHLLGEPRGVRALADRDPAFPQHADTRVDVALRLAGGVRATVHTLHSHVAPAGHAMSQLQLTGTRGVAVAKLGVNLCYPEGEPDELHVSLRGGAWKRVRLAGSWFPDAFAGPMQNLQRYAAGEDEVLVTRVEDALRTMALVEACYRSSAAPLTRIPR